MHNQSYVASKLCRVLYKREGHDRCLGPGKVVFQDGKIVFVRHGGKFVRVAPNRLIKAGSEFAAKGNDEPGSGDWEAGGGHQELQSKEESQHQSRQCEPVLDNVRSIAWSERLPEVAEADIGASTPLDSTAQANTVAL